MVQDPPTLLLLSSTSSRPRDLTFRVKNIWGEKRQMWRWGGSTGLEKPSSEEKSKVKGFTIQSGRGGK